MLGTMCVREDVRPTTLLYANRDWESIIFREQLDELALYMPSLTVVHVLQHPPSGWTGESGRVTPDLVARLAADGFDEQFGARPLHRHVRRTLEKELTRAILAGELPDGAQVTATLGDEGVALRVAEQPEPAIA